MCIRDSSYSQENYSDTGTCDLNCSIDDLPLLRKLCTAILIDPQGTEDGSEFCTLPGGEEVNFYQVIPLYEDELDYKLEHDVDALLNKMRL